MMRMIEKIPELSGALLHMKQDTNSIEKKTIKHQSQTKTKT